MGFRETSILWKVNICAQILGLLLCVVGYATNYLASIPDYHVHNGLWKACYRSTDNDICSDSEKLIKNLRKSMDIGWLDASKVMMGVSMGAEALCLVVTVLGGHFNTKLTSVAGVVIAIGSVLLGIIGSAVAVANSVKLWDKHWFNDDIDKASPDWSYGLFMGGQLAFCVAAGLHGLDARQRGR